MSSNIEEFVKHLKEKIEIVNTAIAKLEKERTALYGLLEVYEPDEVSIAEKIEEPELSSETERIRNYDHLVNIAKTLESEDKHKEASEVWRSAMDFAVRRGIHTCRKGIERCKQAVLNQVS